MLAKIGYTWDLMKASMKVLRQDKQILIFPLLSSISCFLVLASFVVPLAFLGHLASIRQQVRAWRAGAATRDAHEEPR